MRIGVFGGSFDPVHVGHLILAEQCREQGQLDRVLFVPAARPPHKSDRTLTPFHHRVEMLTLALSGHPAFAVDDLEKDRPGPSYTVETLAELRRRDPSADWWLILGADSVRDLPLWRQPREIVAQAGILAVERPGVAAPDRESLRQALGVDPEFPLRLSCVTSPLIGVSSTDLRRRLAEGRSVRYQMPRAAEAYAADKGLYAEPS